jgi:nucleoredoxin
MGKNLVWLVMALVFGGAIYFIMMQGPTPVAAAPAPVASAPAPAGAPAAADSTEPTGFIAGMDGSLVTQADGSFQDFNPEVLKGVKYYAFYYSASWCPPCRAFTLSLVDFYKQFKPAHPNFELIFVNHDRDEGDMLTYMRDDDMTWPAVRYDDIERVNADRFCGSGIPDLVLVDSNGNVLSDSFEGGQYVGPQKVVADIQTMVPKP